jgi:hypothetical protein
MLPHNGRYNQPYDPPIDPRHRSPSPMGYEMEEPYRPARQNTGGLGYPQQSQQQHMGWDDGRDQLVAQPTVSSHSFLFLRSTPLIVKKSTLSTTSPTATMMPPRSRHHAQTCAHPATISITTCTLDITNTTLATWDTTTPRMINTPRTPSTSIIAMMGVMMMIRDQCCRILYQLHPRLLRNL